DATYLDLVMGGGLREFLPNDHQLKGKREDGRNLIEQWQNVSSRTLLLDAQALRTWQVDPKQQVLGLFNTSHMAYEIHRNPDREPSLSEMTAKALDYFIHGSQDFVLMVESGRIDHGHHAGIAKLALTETEQLHHTVQMTIERLRQANLLDDTLIIVTADHSHVMTISGYQSRGTPILGLVSNNQGTPMLALDGKPMTTLSYANGPGARQGSREDLSLVDTFADDFQQPALVPLSSETHAGEDVAIHATGPGSQWFQGLVEQNYVFHVINHALALNTSIQ
ncbi:alkaline phosphatase, partial [Vibrio metschnikovii]|nr:alkaline phosphatase [Vibrio metschnikovii]